MVSIRANVNQTVVKWWNFTRWSYRFYFDLMSDFPPYTSKQQQSQLLMLLHRYYSRFVREDYPRAAESIRQHLLASMADLIESLHHLSQDRGEESRIHYENACHSFTEMLYELLAYGISEKDITR